MTRLTQPMATSRRNLFLALREQPVASDFVFNRRHAEFGGAAFGDGASDGGQQFFRVDGVLQKVAGPLPHGVDRGVDVGVGREKNDRDAIGASAQLVKEFHAVHFRHMQIQNHAPVAARGVAREKGGSGIKKRDFVPFAGGHEFQGSAQRLVVVDDADERIVRHGSTSEKMPMVRLLAAYSR